MTITDILSAIEEQSKLIAECNQRIEAFNPWPSFFHADEISKLEDLREDAYSLRESLFDRLREGTLEGWWVK